MTIIFKAKTECLKYSIFNLQFSIYRAGDQYFSCLKRDLSIGVTALQYRILGSPTPLGTGPDNIIIRIFYFTGLAMQTIGGV